MGYMMVVGNCIFCRKVFSFNPYFVPSISTTGRSEDREPVCEDDMLRINAEREKRGLSPFVIDPRAYLAEEVL